MEYAAAHCKGSALSAAALAGPTDELLGSMLLGGPGSPRELEEYRRGAVQALQALELVRSPLVVQSSTSPGPDTVWVTVGYAI